MSLHSYTAKLTEITSLAHLCHIYFSMKLRHRIELTQAEHIFSATKLHMYFVKEKLSVETRLKHGIGIRSSFHIHTNGWQFRRVVAGVISFQHKLCHTGLTVLIVTPSSVRTALDRVLPGATFVVSTFTVTVDLLHGLQPPYQSYTLR